MALLSSSLRDFHSEFSVSVFTKLSTRKKSNHHSQRSADAAQRAGLTDVVPGAPSPRGEKEMFRSMSGEGHLSGGQSSSSSAGRGVGSAGLGSQESSWIGLLPRPAMAFLQRYLPERLLPPARSDPGPGWIRGGFKTSFVEEESLFLRQLREMEIQGAEEMDLNLYQQTQIGYLSSARTFFSHVLLSLVSSQEIKPTGGKHWEPAGLPVKNRRWWGSLWQGEESPHEGLMSDGSWSEEAPVTGRLGPQQPVAETKAPTTADVFVQTRRWMLGENAGPTDLKEEPANNGGLQTVQNTEGSATDHQPLSIAHQLGSPGAAAACSEVALLTPEQDNGYSSLEEEHSLSVAKVLSDEADAVGNSTASQTDMEDETSEQGELTSGIVDEEEEEEEQEVTLEEGQSVDSTVLSTPQCPNKTIAFIMGCPCSDEDSSQSDGETSDDDDDDDDDGFNSEGSSDLSNSTSEDDEDDEASDSEVDSEAERLWSSLCQSRDPYNPRNFTARLYTIRTPPRTIPTATPPSSSHSSPASSPDLAPLPLSSLAASPPVTSSSPPSGNDTWDDSASASEVDEAESLRLWSSFSCSSDPYSPFNFQAPLRTREPVEAGPSTSTRTRTKKVSRTPSRSPRHHPASPPEYRKEEAEERLDSGFSEPSTSSTTKSCSATKKVRFCDHVEEFMASCDEEEDRRGPWEELARDRFRFLKRCQEVELSIAYCLQPQHRSVVYRRLAMDA